MLDPVKLRVRSELERTQSEQFVPGLLQGGGPKYDLVVRANPHVRVDPDY